MQLSGRRDALFILHPYAALMARGKSLHFLYEVCNVPCEHLSLCSHGLELLCRLAHVKPLNLGVDSMLILRGVPVGG